MSSPLDGLASGLSTTDLINQLIQLERAPQARLALKRQKSQTVINAIQGVNAKLSALRDGARNVAAPSFWTSMKATSSAADVAAASAASGSLAGNLSFTVTALAASGGVASTGTVSSTAATVSTGTILLATGTKELGISSVKAGAGLTVDDHVIEVTQATTAAVKTGTAPLAGATIGGTNDELDVTVNGVVQSITLDAGTYTASELVDEINSKAGGTFTASLDGSGHLVLTTAREGSLATIQVTGGDALAGLNLSVDGAAITGGDGTVEVNGVVATVNSAGAGITQDVLSDDGGTITLSFSGGLRTGSVTGKAIDTGDDSLAATVAAINAAKFGVAAAAVKVGTSSYRLQLSATSTGIAGDLGIAADAFSGLGLLAATSAAADAEITVGSGAGAYSITSATNTVTDVLPGVTLTLKTLGAATIDVQRDSERFALAIGALVDAANGALKEIKAQTAFNATTKVGGPLMSTFGVRTLQANLLTSIVDSVAGSSLESSSLAGVSTKGDGTLVFDKAKFLAAYADDPDAVSALFVRAGTASAGNESFVAFKTSTDKTLEGTYAVNVTVAAERATASGLTAPALETLALGETIEVRVGTTVATYVAAAGATLTEVADGLNAAMAEEALNMVATVESGRLVLRTTAYGGAATFDVRSTRSDEDADQTGIVDVANVWETHSGVDVEGTINGVVASGSGQVLTAPGDDDTLAGLALTISATAPGAYGTFTYSPGVSQRLASVADFAIDTVSGTLTALIEGRTTEIERLTDQIERFEVRITARALRLRKQFTAMEIALQRSQGQMQWLQGQINSMQANNGR